MLATSSWQLLSLIDVNTSLLSLACAFVAHQATQTSRVWFNYFLQRITATIRWVSGAIQIIQTRRELVKARAILGHCCGKQSYKYKNKWRNNAEKLAPFGVHYVAVGSRWFWMYWGLYRRKLRRKWHEKRGKSWWSNLWPTSWLLYYTVCFFRECLENESFCGWQLIK